MEMRKLSTIQKRENLNTVYALDEAGCGGASHEEICLVLLACNGIVVSDSPSCPVYLHGISGFMRNSHSSYSYTCPAAIFIVKLCAHVGSFTVCAGTLAIFLPEQSEGHAFL